MIKSNMSYREVEEYILSIPKFTTKNHLEETREFFNVLGKPGTKSRIIHIAGTNGKGSVCAYLNSILTKAGYRVGMFTSPHLITMKERIRMQGVPVAQTKFVESFYQVFEHINQMKAGEKEYHPTFFELLFFMGMIIFEKEKPDYIILETGMGGRLDATNVVSMPVLSIITEVGLDHMKYLGDSVEKIAYEKAGIIKNSVPVIVMDKSKEATRVICEQARQMNSDCYLVSSRDLTIFQNKNKSIDFSYQSKYYEYSGLLVRTLALYQTQNAALAIEAVEILWRDKQPYEYERFIKDGLASMQWEGRMEEILPDVIVDGAHNEDGIEALMQTVRVNTDKRNVLLFAVVNDKDYQSMIKILLADDLFERIYITSILNDRTVLANRLESVFRQYTKKEIYLFSNPETAFSQCLKDKKPEERIYAAGSLYLAGTLKELGRRNGND